MTTKIPVLLCIDIEPDERKLDPTAQPDWLGFEKSYDYFNQLRDSLVEATGSPVHFSWFLRMDPQITHVYGSPDWVVTRYRDLIKALEATGDELGLHTHAIRWDENSRDWIADYQDQEWIDHCVRSSCEAFQTSMARRCQSFRFGDHWMNDRTSQLLENLEVEFDLTPEFSAGPPQMDGETFTGAFPDYTRIPQAPYRPSKKDFKRRGKWRRRDLWILPVSAGGLGDTNPSDHRLGRNGSQKQNEYMSLILSFDPQAFSTIGNNLLSGLAKPYLALPARADMVIEPRQRANLDENIRYIQSHPRIKDFVFETPAEAIRRLTG